MNSDDRTKAAAAELVRRHDQLHALEVLARPAVEELARRLPPGAGVVVVVTHPEGGTTRLTNLPAPTLLPLFEALARDERRAS